MSLSASSFSITVECLTSNPMTEHSLIFITGDFIFFIILTSKFIKAELMSLFATFELIIIDSK